MTLCCAGSPDNPCRCGLQWLLETTLSMLEARASVSGPDIQEACFLCSMISGGPRTSSDAPGTSDTITAVQ